MCMAGRTFKLKLPRSHVMTLRLAWNSGTSKLYFFQRLYSSSSNWPVFKTPSII